MAYRCKTGLSSSKDMKTVIEAKCREILVATLAEDENRNCFDCLAKGPRWASWNLGVFLCIRCAGLHRKMGVHISKIKSVDLDSWTPDQVSCVQQMGNRRGRACYEAKLEFNCPRPQAEGPLELFIREKYEGLRYAKDGFQLPKAAERIEWLEEILAERSGHRRKPNAGRDAFPMLAKPPGFTGISVPMPKNDVQQFAVSQPDLFEVDPSPSPLSANTKEEGKQDLATLLGGDLVPNPGQSKESIMALFGNFQSGSTNCQQNFFGN
ncbi:unnamed protein product [Notodromas monacha]|uniref:Arf-GAP domain-containing protein n=1 Tax=Notodromas monacha TaxID=399045 RepID=A0A7R9GBD2_9CRUS|nr:unnamed protein product [Notodromas monacha]CAG0914948.1 unnamed protein product [Notodromas monacha]